MVARDSGSAGLQTGIAARQGSETQIALLHYVPTGRHAAVTDSLRDSRSIKWFSGGRAPVRFRSR